MDYPSEEIIRLVKSLHSSRERYILELRLGIDAERQYTLQEIADRLNVTRERVRQIQNRALSKLRNEEINSLLLVSEMKSPSKWKPRGNHRSKHHSNSAVSEKTKIRDMNESHYIVVTFKEAVIGKDPVDKTAFHSTRHKLLAEWARQDGMETVFVMDGQVIASWPTNQISFITWPNGLKVPSSPREFASRMEEIKHQYPKAWSKWSWEEEQRLILEFHNGKTVKEIANLLGRAPGGIFSRLRKIKLIPEYTEFNEELSKTLNEVPFVMSGNVYQLVNQLYGVNLVDHLNTKLHRKFSEIGWFRPTDKLFLCPDCSKYRIVVFRRHWKNVGRIFHRWAIVCLECARIGESRDFNSNLLDRIHETFEAIGDVSAYCPECE